MKKFDQISISHEYLFPDYLDNPSINSISDINNVKNNLMKLSYREMNYLINDVPNRDNVLTQADIRQLEHEYNSFFIAYEELVAEAEEFYGLPPNYQAKKHLYLNDFKWNFKASNQLLGGRTYYESLKHACEILLHDYNYILNWVE